MEEPEKREAITELLADVTEDSTAEIIDAVFVFWNGLRDAELKKVEEEKEKALAAAKGKQQQQQQQKERKGVLEGGGQIIF